MRGIRGGRKRARGYDGDDVIVFFIFLTADAVAVDAVFVDFLNNLLFEFLVSLLFWNKSGYF